MRGSGSWTRLPSGSIRVTVVIGGRPVKRTCRDERAARAEQKRLYSLKLAVERGEAALPAPGRVLVRELAEGWLEEVEAGVERRYSDKTQRGYRRDLRVVLDRWGPVRAEHVRTEDVRAWIADLARSGQSASSIRHFCDRLSQILRHGVETGRVTRMPRIPRPRPQTRTPRQPVSDTFFARWLDRADRGERLALLLARDAGLRAGEIGYLRGVDILIRADHHFLGWIRVAVLDEQRRPKAGRERWVPILSARLAAALEVGRSVGAERLVPLAESTLAHRLRTLCGGSPLHACRHSWISEMLGAYPIQDVMSWAGHEDLRTTQRYAHPLIEPPDPAEFDTLLTRATKDRRGLRVVTPTKSSD